MNRLATLVKVDLPRGLHQVLSRIRRRLNATGPANAVREERKARPESGFVIKFDRKYDDPLYPLCAAACWLGK
jgi:hypothetical protein